MIEGGITLYNPVSFSIKKAIIVISRESKGKIKVSLIKSKCLLLSVAKTIPL
jgi:hypothetical protein